MRMKFVAPGVPSGRPATTMTRCPGAAKRSLNAMRQARSTMSFWPFARDTQTGRAGAGPADDRREIERLGNLPRRGGDRIGASPLRFGMQQMNRRQIGSVVYDLLGDAVHGRDGFDRVLY